MIRLKSQPLRTQYSDSLSQDDSSQDVAEDRIRAIRIDEEKNLIHTFEHPSSSVIEEEGQEYESSPQGQSNRKDSESDVGYSDKNEGQKQKRVRKLKYKDEREESELQVSESDEDIDELQRRIRQLESNLSKKLPKDRPKQPLQKENKHDNRNLVHAPEKLMQKQKQKATKPTTNPSKDDKPKLYLKSEAQKLKQSIKIKCNKALTLRQEREELAGIRDKLSSESRLSQVERELQLLKHIDSLQIKLRASINQKVSEMHQEIEEASLKKTKPRFRQTKRGR